MDNNYKQAKDLLSIIEETTNGLIDPQREMYLSFKREFVCFIKLIYDKLKDAEQNALARNHLELGEISLQFGTDELKYSYREFYDFLQEVDRINGKTNTSYNNPLISFRGMYMDFFKLLKEPMDSITGLSAFEDLIRQCLSRLGIDDIKTSIFGGAMIFDIDVCTRISKIKERLSIEQQAFRNSQPGLTYLYVNQYSTYTNYIAKALREWDDDIAHNRFVKNSGVPDVRPPRY